MMDKKQIDMMACPECHANLEYLKATKELVCDACKLAFPVRDGIPVMLIEEARNIAEAK